MKAFRIAQFSKNSKIQKITVKKFFFQNFDTGFLLIGVFRVYSRSFIAKLSKTKKSISSEINPSTSTSTSRSRSESRILLKRDFHDAAHIEILLNININMAKKSGAEEVMYYYH